MTKSEKTINELKEIHGIGEVFLLKIRNLRKDLEGTLQHKWEHGDVFRNRSKEIMIYLQSLPRSKPKVFCLVDGQGGCCGHDPDNFLASSHFLFNIKEKL